MKTFYARHTEKLDIDDETRERLWKQRRIGIHFPHYKSGKLPDRKPDNASLDISDYPPLGKRAMRVLTRLAREGGYVCAEYRGHADCILGCVPPNSKIELFRGKWGSRNGRDGRDAILKTLRITKVRLVKPSSLAIIAVGRPRQGTIMRWHKAGNRIRDAVEGIVVAPCCGELGAEQQETLCAEFLRSAVPPDLGLPRLASLLLPVGRTMRDIDIYGLTESGVAIFGQVTFAHFKACGRKLRALRGYRDGNRNLLILFCDCDKAMTVDGIRIIPLRLAYDSFIATPGGKLWIDRATTISQA